jgi:zinc protease
MVLSVFGDFNRDEVLPLLKKNFSGLPSQDLHLKADNELPLSETREVTLHLNKAQAMVVVGFQGPTLKDGNRYGVEVLASILGESMSGRIFTKIREELGKAYTLGGGFRPGLETGQISFYVITTDAHVEKVKDLLMGQIAEIREVLVSDKELADTKAYIKGTHLMGLETNSSLGFMSMLDELYGLGFDNYQKHNAAIDRVSKEDVQTMAQKYLDPRHAAIIITRPEKVTENAVTP